MYIYALLFWIDKTLSQIIIFLAQKYCSLMVA